jgi:S1-C subfamily serine protease
MRMSWMCAVGLVLWGTTAAAPSVGHPAELARESGATARAGRALSRSFAMVAHAIGPAVVRVDVTGGADDVTASGIILDTRGNVVTSRHTFDGAGTSPSVRVTLADGRGLSAELVGTDAGADVAVVRMAAPPDDLSAARFGDSDDAEVGEWVLAVGSALGLDQSVTAGIISGRPQQDGSPPDGRGAFLLTDAKVNPGDAGGALVDLEGQVVGLTTLISAGPGGGYGYAVPINQVRRTAQAIIQDGHAGHPYIGVGLRELGDLPPTDRGRLGALPSGGAVISRVGRDTPAARAGLRPGDVITAVGDRDVPAPAELVSIIARQPIGARLPLAFVRGGQSHRVVVSVEDLPVPAGTGR